MVINPQQNRLTNIELVRYELSISGTKRLPHICSNKLISWKTGSKQKQYIYIISSGTLKRRYIHHYFQHFNYTIIHYYKTSTTYKVLHGGGMDFKLHTGTKFLKRFLGLNVQKTLTNTSISHFKRHCIS